MAGTRWTPSGQGPEGHWTSTDEARACLTPSPAGHAELAEAAERLAVEWMEHAVAHAADSGEPPHVFSPACATCQAVPGARCTPTHRGEREPGDWCHPSRLLGLVSDGVTDNSRALQDAIDRQSLDTARGEDLDLIARVTYGVDRGWLPTDSTGETRRESDAELRERLRLYAQVYADAAYQLIGAISSREILRSRFGPDE